MLSSGWGNSVTRNWSVDSIVKLGSSKPVNVVYMVPTSYGVAYFRPDVVAGQPLYVVNSSLAGGRQNNPEAFVVTSPGELSVKLLF